MKRTGIVKIAETTYKVELRNHCLFIDGLSFNDFCEKSDETILDFIVKNGLDINFDQKKGNNFSLKKDFKEFVSDNPEFIKQFSHFNSKKNP